MATTAPTNERQADVDRYVALSALSGVTSTIAEQLPHMGDVLEAMGVGFDELTVAWQDEGEFDIESKLWPDDADDETAEHRRARRRSVALEARILIELARETDLLLKRADGLMLLIENWANDEEARDA